MSESSLCWMNGEILPASQATVSVFDHGLLYGDGVFEGIRFYADQPFLLAAHLDRLFDSAIALSLDITYTKKALTDAVEALISAAPMSEGYLRLVVTRGPGAMGIDPRSCRQASVFIIATELAVVDAEVREKGARVIIASTRRPALDTLDPRIKSLNYLSSILARLEANDANADEAIMLNREGRVAEGSVDNVFLVKNAVLATPPTIDGALDGITRKLIKQLASRVGLPVVEKSLAPYDLYCADECFLTGTGAELIPVREIDGRTLPDCPGPWFLKLLAEFRAHTLERK